MLPDAADHTQAAHSDTDCIGTDTKPEPPLWTRHTRLSPLWNTRSGPPARHVVASNTGCSASLPDLLPPRPQHGDAPAPLPSAPGSPRSTPHRGLLPLSICKPYCAGLSGSTSRQLFRGGNCHFLDWPPKHEDGPGAVPGVTPGLRRGGRWQGMLPGRGLPIPTGPPRPAARPSRLGSDAWAGQRASALSAPQAHLSPAGTTRTWGGNPLLPPLRLCGSQCQVTAKPQCPSRTPPSVNGGLFPSLPGPGSGPGSPGRWDDSSPRLQPTPPPRPGGHACRAEPHVAPRSAWYRDGRAGDSSEPAGPHNSADNLGTVAGPLPHST